MVGKRKRTTFIESDRMFEVRRERMESYLIPIHRPEDAPPNSYVLCKMTGGLFYCEFQNYVLLSRYLANSAFTPFADNPHLTLDLSFTSSHSLVFDVDVRFSKTALPTRPLLLSYYDQIFSLALKGALRRLKHFTVIIALREDFTGGMHVHLPEVAVSHDDYLQLCARLQPECGFRESGVGAVLELDAVSKFSLARCSKPGARPYAPFRVLYHDETTSHAFDLHPGVGDEALSKALRRTQKAFRRRKENEDSAFRSLIALERRRDLEARLYELLMPVVVPPRPVFEMSHPTSVVTLSSSDDDHPLPPPPPTEDPFLLADSVDVATFVYDGRKRCVVRKKNELGLCRSDWLKCYKYLSLNAFAITEFQTSNRALGLWYKRNRDKIAAPGASESAEDDVFATVNQRLISDNCGFLRDPHPLRTVMSHDRGFYSLPCFYALCRHLERPSNEVASLLRPVFANDPFLLRLLDKLEAIDPALLSEVSREFTLDTVLYCGSNFLLRSRVRMSERIRIIVRASSLFLEQAETVDDVNEILRKIQERHFPVMTANLRHSCKKPQMYNWNLSNEFWQMVDRESQVEKLMSVVWSTVTEQIRLKSPEAFAEWFIRVGKCVSVKSLVNAILFEVDQDRKTIEMDRHKWHVRTGDGCILDLLTGHVGGTVPEFYVSERKMSVSLDRAELMSLRDERVDLHRAYEVLTDRRFFQLYLKCVFDDVADDLFDALLCLVPSEKDPLLLSMYRFYVHLCKYTSFEYDRLMYMLDVLGSLLVATNYMRKFFILKGVTKNGKSKFFQMISRVFGGYSYAARSANLLGAHASSSSSSASSSQGPMPELASSLFGCRVITVEELSGKLNETLIKEISGNSATSFRNLYEQNAGGIPTTKIFASTNTFPDCISTEAFRDRIVAFPFDAQFCLKTEGMTTSQRVSREMYALETGDAVVEDSHRGFFVLAYLHLVRNVDPKDGNLHYRPEPAALVEFKREVLMTTDIYVQFKRHMDVQVIPNADHLTTCNDLRSAVRYFLRTTRNASVQEADLVIQFDQEFCHLRKTTFGDMGGEYFSTPCLSLLDQPFAPLACRYDGGGATASAAVTVVDSMDNLNSSKMDDTEEASSGGLVYYDNVIIKNLKLASKSNR